MATSPSPQRTDFALDVLGRYVCNGLDEATQSADTSKRPDARPFDIIVIGGGSFGPAVAQHLFFKDKTRSHRILVLEAGPFVLPEHVQNLPTLGDVSVWGLPWRSNVPGGFPGLAYCVGGRSIFFGGWSPQLLEAETQQWPSSVVEQLRKTLPDGSPSYFRQASEQIGVNVTNDFIFGALHEALRQKLFEGINANPSKVPDAIPLLELRLLVDDVPAGQDNLFKLEAPLAVQNRTRSGFFPFNKFSAVPLLTQVARAAWAESGGDDVKKRLMIAPNCHVTRLVTTVSQGVTRVTEVLTNQGSVVVPDTGVVVIALGTIESARLALISFPLLGNTNLIGRNLMAHLRSNLTIRIPRSALPIDPATKDLQASALFVKGRRTINGAVRHFHLQITAAGLNKPGSDSEAELFKKVPDFDTFDVFRQADDNTVVLTIRGIGEMEAQNPTNGVTLASELDEYGLPRAFVTLVPSDMDNKLWEAMDKAADDVAKVFAGNQEFEVLTSSGFVKVAPDANLPALVPYTFKTDGGRRDGMGTTHHEAGTLWIGDNAAASVTNPDGRFHEVANAYVAGPALFPTVGSPNPMLTGVALARRTADHLVERLRPVFPPLEPGFRYLFDGTEGTYKLWQTVGQGTFELIDGAIVVRPGGDLGLFYYPQSFGDFILRLQFRLDQIDDNSGVFVRSRNPRLPVPRRSPPNPPNTSDLYINQAYVPVDTGFEIQIDELARGNKTKNPPEPDGMDKKRTGAIYDIPTTPGLIQQTYQRGPALQPGQWNDYEIEVKKGPAGDIYTVRLNGQQTTTYTNPDGYRGKSVQVDPDSGFLGLQSHTGRVAFRNIRIKRL